MVFEGVAMLRQAEKWFLKASQRCDGLKNGF
jgi:hypothetical protein